MEIKYHVVAKRWFQKSAGNTYHSCRVYKDRVLVGEVPYTYGYGEGYRQTAHEILLRAGETDIVKYSDFLEWERENDYPILWEVHDVTRKRDM